MKKLLLIASLLIAAIQLQAQQFPLFSNYVTNSFAFNPAMIGASNVVDVRFLYRTQWTSLANAPKTLVAGVNSRVGKSPLSLGGYFYNDTAGELLRKGGTAMMSYTQNLSDETSLSLGVAGGYYNLSLSESYVANQNTDPTLSTATSGIGLPDFNVGLLLKHKGAYAGFSIPQVFERKLEFSDVLNKSVLHRNYYGMLGYQIDVGDKFAIEPSALLKYTKGSNLQYDISLRGFFNKSLWIGGGYRSEDAAVVMAGIESKMFALTYAYDVTTSQLSNVSSGSHEITLGLRVPRVKDRDKDGIPDDEDKCPDVPGVKENEGCPANDKDKDGIIDPDDKCPDVPGVKENDGCPLDDKDQDGIIDKDDKCPDVPGTKEKQGCPDTEKDTDGDGIPDARDMCPNVPGSKENSGCPFADRDNDGLRDDVDKCPDIPGVVKNLGCPIDDRDQDGVVDGSDPCPDEAGPIANLGCPPGKGPNGKLDPNADRDMDGTPDVLDKCPNTAGPRENSGCPIIAKQAQEILDITTRNIYFDYDRAELRAESFRYLDNLAKWMKDHPEYNLYMGGHTDSRGSDAYNMELSKNRVFAVSYYLQDKGITGNRIRLEYFGESKPIADNVNEQGRQRNRRVETKFEFD